MTTSFNEVCPVSETEGQKQCPCKCRKIAAVILIVLIAGVACWYIHHPNRPRSINPKPGMMCVIHFRQDAFTFRANTGTSLPIIDVGGVSTTVAFRGTMIAVDREAILFDAVHENITFNGVPKTSRFWIPKNNILLIEYEPPNDQTDHAEP
jgi:hypothetical protein